MSYTTRKDLFEKIETHRSRPLREYPKVCVNLQTDVR